MSGNNGAWRALPLLFRFADDGGATNAGFEIASSRRRVLALWLLI